MIDVKDKSQCCGCGACAQRCPVSCITMHEDENGFLYPQVDVDACVDCHACEQVCPFLNRQESQDPVVCLAAANPDEAQRTNASSGGLFMMLASRVIEQGGVVFGARFNDAWDVVHDAAQTLEDLAPFCTSKYVQSAIGDSYRRAKGFLQQGRMVMFTGTPCQIAGLRLFLGEPQERLIAVEVACHGVPSPGVWRTWLKKCSGGKAIQRVNFRDKSTGWRGYSVLIGESRRHHDDDDYMVTFLDNYNLRPSCFNCPSKNGSSGADITLADLWGCDRILSRRDDNKGMSAVIVRSDKGRRLVEQCVADSQVVDYNEVVKYNPALVRNAVRPDGYDLFWKRMSKSPLWTLKRYRFLGGAGLSAAISRFKVYLHHRLH